MTSFQSWVRERLRVARSFAAPAARYAERIDALNLSWWQKHQLLVKIEQLNTWHHQMRLLDGLAASMAEPPAEGGPVDKAFKEAWAHAHGNAEDLDIELAREFASVELGEE